MRYPAKISKKYLLKLSIPIFFSNLAIPLVSIVDTWLAGHLGSAKFLAATSIAASLVTMIFWSFGFLRMGTVGLVSQSLGKGDYREIILSLLRSLSLALIIGFLIAFMQYPILIFAKYFFSASKETHLLIDEYIRIRLYSAPAELSMYVLVGFFLGLQKTKISSILITFFSIINILFSYHLVVRLGLEIKGIALGTVLSAYLTILIFLFYTFYFIKDNFNIIPRYKNIFIRKKIFKLLNINYDIFIRTVLLTFSFLWVTFQGAKLGDDYLAINSILMQFILMASFLLDAYAFSTEGVVGFALGRRVKKSFITVVRNSFELSFFTSLLISLTYLIFFKNIINMLTDLEYLRFLSYSFMIWIILIPPIASFCYQYDGIFIGTSQTKELRNAMIISCIIFIISSEYLVMVFANHGIWLSFVIFMVLRSLTLRMYFSKILIRF